MTTSDPGLVISEVGRRYLRLQLATDVGPVRLHNLIKHFGSLEAVFSASTSELRGAERIGPKTADAIFRARDNDSVDREIARAVECGVRIVCAEDEDYPKPLLNIPDPPICLCIRGALLPTDGVAISIVGTRRCSHYGREQALRFGEMLGAAGFTVVSGLARGVDGHAHEGALRSGGRTLAVLGNGLSSIYPPEHSDLAERIIEAGALISEFPIDARPEPQNFPRRNRIIAGLSLGVIVLEAGRNSGALITARFANEYNREVFAIPGRVDHPARSAGVNGLIRDGQAKLVTCFDDVLEELSDVGTIMGYGGPVTGKRSDDADDEQPGGDHEFTSAERAILEAMAEGAEAAEEICSLSKVEPSRVMAGLTTLQLRGLVRRLPRNRFVRTSPARRGDERT